MHSKVGRLLIYFYVIYHAVDIDLVYLPLSNRETALAGIERALLNIKQEIIKRFPGMAVIEKRVGNQAHLAKLIVGIQVSVSYLRTE